MPHYLIMRGDSPEFNYLPARETRAEAQGECDRINEYMAKQRECLKLATGLGAGMLRAMYDKPDLWVKEIE